MLCILNEQWIIEYAMRDGAILIWPAKQTGSQCDLHNNDVLWDYDDVNHHVLPHHHYLSVYVYVRTSIVYHQPTDDAVYLHII